MTLIWERAFEYDAALGKPLSWAIAITRNKAIDRLRSAQRKHRLVLEAASEFMAQEGAGGMSTERPAIAGEDASALRHALVSLPPGQRQAIELAFFAGLTQSEIAAQLGEPLGTIKARIRRGMMTLRDALEGKL
jgi:RNA polymerase sigma-70 factor (ECF subfamily)